MRGGALDEDPVLLLGKKLFLFVEGRTSEGRTSKEHGETDDVISSVEGDTFCMTALSLGQAWLASLFELDEPQFEHAALMQKFGLVTGRCTSWASAQCGPSRRTATSTTTRSTTSSAEVIGLFVEASSAECAWWAGD